MTTSISSSGSQAIDRDLHRKMEEMAKNRSPVKEAVMVGVMAVPMIANTAIAVTQVAASTVVMKGALAVQLLAEQPPHVLIGIGAFGTAAVSSMFFGAEPFTAFGTALATTVATKVGEKIGEWIGERL